MDKISMPAAPGAVNRRSVLKGGAALSLGAMMAPGLAAPALAQSRTVHLGCSLPLTGPYEKVSRIYKDAYEFWSETVGHKMSIGGQDYDVRWTIYDDENSAARTAQLTERLITTDNVDLIVGAYGTDTVLAQGAIARKHGRITIQAGAASQRVDEEIGGHTTFTLVGLARNYGRLAIEKLGTQEPKPRNIAIVTFDDPVYLEMAAGIEDMAQSLGIEVALKEVLPMQTQDLRPTVLKLKRLGEVDIVYNCGWDIICIKLVQEFAALDFTPKAFVGGHLTTNPVVKETLGRNLDYVMGVTFWLPQMAHSDDHFASAQEFADAFKAAKGYAPTYHAAMAYTVPYIYAHVLRDATGDTPFDPAALRAKIAALDGLPTMWGPISFNEKGRIDFPGLPVLQWQGNDPQLTVIHPDALATGTLQYPMAEFRSRG
ncbi:MAG: amino acid ABC transporter substrate-binding protein [Rhodobacteraceae bacterium]|jgi:branched-chain amino acid transport system substrate-binding protein|nr:amino acid ABC transporter substrate-binding protein [Paracoccaceae bacterium]